MTSGCEYEVIVVDNGSTDGTLEYLDTLVWVRLIKNSENLGFTKGNNIGIRATRDTDVVLLNNDIVITQKDWLSRMQQTAYASGEIGMVGCRLVNEQGLLLHAGTFIYPETYWGQQIGGCELEINQYSQIREVEGIVFACAYLKREVVSKVGGLDEAFFAYFEDTDYCFRVNQAGYKVVCSGDVTLMHYENTSTTENNSNFSGLFLNSQKTFKSKWSRTLEHKYSHQLAWHSIVNFPSGYAVSSRNFMIELDKKGVDVRYKYVYGRGTTFPVDENGVIDNYRINIFTQRQFRDDCPQVVYGQGDVFWKNSGKYRVGFTMLEVTGIPKEWVDNANEMNEVWVPSRFNSETFRDSGVKVPIHVIPLGIDPNYFHPEIQSYKLQKKYTFLSVFEWGERKAPEKLLNAFAHEFKVKDDVVLLCKVINNDGSIDVPSEITKLGLPSGHAPIVFIFNQAVSCNIGNVAFVHRPEIPGCQMGTLYRSADCFVLPTRGEGWGMPILEAMACGLPVIVTDWSAHCDFINHGNAYPLRVKRLISAKAKCPYYAGLEWADADEDHLMFLMRHVFENQEEARNRGLVASKDVLTNWTWKKAAEKIVNRLDLITDKHDSSKLRTG